MLVIEGEACAFLLSIYRFGLVLIWTYRLHYLYISATALGLAAPRLWFGRLALVFQNKLECRRGNLSLFRC